MVSVHLENFDVVVDYFVDYLDPVDHGFVCLPFSPFNQVCLSFLSMACMMIMPERPCY